MKFPTPVALLATLHILWVLLGAPSAHGQVTITSPASQTRIRACDDLATDLYADPWDMSNSSDINNHISGDVVALAGATFSGGTFSAVTEAAQAATFYLFSPQILGTTRAGGRYGQDLNITAARAQKYRQLAIRMYSDTAEPYGGIRFIFNRGTDYVPNRTVTYRFPTQQGWHVYRFDMPTLSISAGESSNTDPWSAGSITSLAIMPAAFSGSHIKIDYIRLEDPTSCPTVTIAYQATANASGSRYSLFLDDNNDPLDGYVSRLTYNQAASGNPSTLPVDTDGLAPGTAYKVVGFLHNDYATLANANPWDMSQMGDILAAQGVSAISSDGSVVSGTSTSGSPALYLHVDESGIDASVFKRFSMKLSQSSPSSVILFWSNASGGAGSSIVTDSNLDGVYELDLGGVGSWSGSIRELAVRPVTVAGHSFSIDFVSLRTSGYVSSLPAPVISTSSGSINPNTPPILSILRPNREGGEAFQSWNMNVGDAALTSNLAIDTDPAFPSEPLTGYLPDVRVVEGNRGDFLKGTNLLGNDDPNVYFTFPSSKNRSVIDADSYRNLCLKLLIQHDLDVCLGSIVKPIWLNEDKTFTDPMAAIAIYNRWSGGRWYEYCFDLPNMNLLGTAPKPWAGNITGFRIDPHEFSRDTCGSNGAPTGNPTQTTFMLDWVKLTKDVTADTGATTILLDTVDPDDSATVALFINTSPSTSGGTKVADGISSGKRVHILPTNAIADGTYYLYAVADDGLNTFTRLAEGRLVVRNQGGSTRSSPLLNLEAPVSGQTVCTSLQLKGFSIQPDKRERVTAVELFRGGSSIGVLEPRDFSPAARLAYSPSAYESSNSGFNGSFDISSWPLGQNVVEVKAYSPDGAVTSSGTITVTRAATGCSDPLADPAPSGEPAAMDAPDIARPTATPIPTFKKPLIRKASISKAGVLTLLVTDANDRGRSCSVSLAVSSKPTSSFRVVKALTTKSSTYSATLSGSRIKSGPLKRAYLRISKSCAYGSGATTAQLTFQQSGKGKIGTLSKLANHLRGLP